MQIQLNTDKHIVGSPELQTRVESMLRQELKHLANDITRIEVHLNDENSLKGGASDKRCQLEARVAGMQPVSAQHHAPSVELAIIGAAEQLGRTLRSTLDKARDSRQRAPGLKRTGQDTDET